MWPSTYFVKDSMSIDRDFSLPLVIPRQSGLMTCRDKHGHLHPLSKTQCLSIETTLVSISSSRDNQVQWHAKTNHGHPHLFHPETSESDGTLRQIMVIHTLCYLEERIRQYQDDVSVLITFKNFAGSAGREIHRPNGVSLE